MCKCGGCSGTKGFCYSPRKSGWVAAIFVLGLRFGQIGGEEWVRLIDLINLGNSIQSND